MKSETDLIVVGYGAAGAAAALTAARSGAKVIILEKQPQDLHVPSTRMSGGLIMGATDAERATLYLDACAKGMIPTAVNQAWAERSLGIRDWLREIGIETVIALRAWYTAFDGYEAIEVFAPLERGVDPASVQFEPPPAGEGLRGAVPFGNGSTLHDLLVEAVSAEPNITCIFDRPAARLIQQDGRVAGVTCASGETFLSRHGVVLACGGFEQNQEMILNYLKAYPIYFYGSPANTGDGIRMAQALGADLWHMNQMIGRAIGHFTHSDGRELSVSLSISPEGYAIVDKYGRRFANEFQQAVSKPSFYYELLHYDADNLEHPRIPAFWIFDSRRMKARPLSGGVMGHYQWSKDNRAEVELGWIAEADSVEEAARLAGCKDPAGAARTIADYNAACATGADALGRPAASLVPIDAGPFYCVPLYPGGATTNGGPRRDEKARVLDVYGDPITGLYAAGELGGPIGILYPAPGANLGEALVFGAIAAETALAN